MRATIERDNAVRVVGEYFANHHEVVCVLHELKSDVISLYIFKIRLNELIENFDIKNVYQIFLSELFRYMRRGSLLHYADGGSAYLAYKYFINSEAITVDRKFIHYIDYEKLSHDIDILCEELLNIFDEGNQLIATEFVDKLVEFESLTSKELPKELEFLNDYSIPFNITIQNNPSI